MSVGKNKNLSLKAPPPEGVYHQFVLVHSFPRDNSLSNLDSFKCETKSFPCNKICLRRRKNKNLSVKTPPPEGVYHQFVLVHSFPRDNSLFNLDSFKCETESFSCIKICLRRRKNKNLSLKTPPPEGVYHQIVLVHSFPGDNSRPNLESFNCETESSSCNKICLRWP